MTVVHVSEVYRHSPPGILAVGKDASAVAKDHVIPLSRCQGNNACLSNRTTTTAAMEPVIGCKDLANQRSLSDKLDLVMTSTGTYTHIVYPAWMWSIGWAKNSNMVYTSNKLLKMFQVLLTLYSHPY